MTLEEFLDKVCQRPMPQNQMARIRTLAKELAEGVVEEVWVAHILATKDTFRDIYGWWPEKHQKNLWFYLYRRWDNNFPRLKLLELNKYIELFENINDNTKEFTVSKFAFDLLEETEPSTIFISYKRSESSAFALLVLKYLKAEGLEPFLDMALVPGEDWHDGLKERIQTRDYFILLIGKTTLESLPVVKEIEWAMEKGLDVIPFGSRDLRLRPKIGLPYLPPSSTNWRTRIQSECWKKIHLPIIPL